MGSRCHLAWVLLAAGGLCLPVGCAGYHIGAETLYPPDIRTVYVPIFESSSLRRNLGERLTEAVKKKIEQYTPYKLADSLANADSVLSGRIVGETKRVLVENPFDDAREVEVNFRVAVSWVNRRRQSIHPTQAIPIPPEVLISQSATLVPEVGQSIATAHQAAIDQLANQIVALMEVPW